MPPRPERAVFIGLARDCAPMLPAVLDNLARMAATFAQSAFLFVENDSRDATRAILERWCRSQDRAAILSPEGPAAHSLQRTVRLAALRNQLIDAVRSRFADFDLLVILDCDDVNATPVTDMAGFTHAVDFLLADGSRAAVFANTLGEYYDMWALRQPQRCPDDVWEASMDYALRHRVSDQQAVDAIYTPRLFELKIDAPPMEVDSAFGGLGIYRLPRVLANAARYQGYKVKTLTAEAREIGLHQCEHVPFHAGLRAQGGRLFVLPWLVIGNVEESWVPPSAWRHMMFDLADLEKPAAAPQPEAGRNDPCPCGSGKRYKHCHGALSV